MRSWIQVEVHLEVAFRMHNQEDIKKENPEKCLLMS